ncbi:hypothetical protein HBI73_133020 [Parastagonospora nodorum]|nr:hypothetical protein HBI73_133020 [Parastagonospora nodorum]KAH5344766.1 hypothetical protein HBI48_205720 [Parastagonospora nodorum]KAH5537206.1 hypothetical protein HBI27_146390 [Parastagonospora nodorum]KAH5596309.1 hypothetical protein HBI45_180710 [Parastagonospora nodorum]KAH5669402.1 hypothetical protein HBI21_199950 [Parastagonospora nodorum]
MPPREVFFLNTWSGRHQYENSYDKLLDQLQDFVRTTKSPYKYRFETEEHIHEEKVLSFDLTGRGKAHVLK